MTRMKSRFLGVLALGALLGPFIWSAGSKSFLQAQDPSKATKPTAKPAAPAPKADAGDQAAGRAAIEKATQAFVEAYSKGDVDRVAASLSEGAELISDDAPPLRGRDALRQALTNYFAENPPKKITRAMESVRFASKHSAVEEGILKVAVGNEAPKNMRYSLQLVEEDGKWLITSIKEWPADNGDILDLEWLIGSWEAKRPDAELKITYEWFGDKSFIRSLMNIRQKDRTLTTMQVIGVDPRTDELRIWTFESDGGFAEGTCTREGNTWIFESHGEMADGSELSATNILLRVNNDTITWQPVNLTIGDDEIGDLPPVKVTRMKPSK